MSDQPVSRSDTTEVLTQPVAAELPERITRALGRDGQPLASEAATERPGEATSEPPSERDGGKAVLDLDGPRYSVAGEVGRGGMGTVVQARDNDLLREVAMKVLGRSGGSELRRFVQEAQVTSQLDHPSVLPVYDLGINEAGQPYFTMKLVRQHQTLADVIDLLRAQQPAATRTYTFERRVQMVQRVCHALRYAHQRGVVHRDIKPQNIVVGPFGEVYLVDWGIAKLAAGAEDTPEAPPALDTELSRETDPHVLLGTPAYMAPEQALAKPADSRSDVYSLCATLYEFLTLHYYLGHVSGGAPQVLRSVLQVEPVDAEHHKAPVHGRVPRPLSRICRKGLAKHPDERFTDAGELEDALQAWLEGGAPIVCSGTCMQRGLRAWSRWIDRHPVVVPIASFVVIALFLRWLVVSAWELLQLFGVGL